MRRHQSALQTVSGFRTTLSPRRAGRCRADGVERRNERKRALKEKILGLFKKEEKTTAEVLAENEAMFAQNLKEYAESVGQQAPTLENDIQQTGGTSAPSAPKDNGPLTPGDDIPGGL